VQALFIRLCTLAQLDVWERQLRLLVDPGNQEGVVQPFALSVRPNITEATMAAKAIATCWSDRLLSSGQLLSADVDVLSTLLGALLAEARRNLAGQLSEASSSAGAPSLAGKAAKLGSPLAPATPLGQAPAAQFFLSPQSMGSSFDALVGGLPSSLSSLAAPPEPTCGSFGALVDGLPSSLSSLAAPAGGSYGVLVDGLPSSLSSAWGPSSPPAAEARSPSADGAWPAVTSDLLGLSSDSDEQTGEILSGSPAL
jgi:hypothetical protein